MEGRNKISILNFLIYFIFISFRQFYNFRFIYKEQLESIIIGKWEEFSIRKRDTSTLIFGFYKKLEEKQSGGSKGKPPSNWVEEEKIKQKWQCQPIKSILNFGNGQVHSCKPTASVQSNHLVQRLNGFSNCSKDIMFSKF